MQTRFYINASGFSPFEREHLKRDIINQGRRQGITARIITEFIADDEFGARHFRVTVEGDCMRVVAYEAAVMHWFHDRPESLLPNQDLLS